MKNGMTHAACLSRDIFDHKALKGKLQGIQCTNVGLLNHSILLHVCSLIVRFL